MPLSNIWKTIGVIISLLAVFLNVLFFITDFQLTIPVFALSAYFMEHKMLATFPTNVSDEIILLLYLIGLALTVFSKEKNENQEMLTLKYTSFIKAAMINTVFLILSVLFIYGGSFVGILVFNFISTFIFYQVLFYLAKYRMEKVNNK